MDTHLVIIKGDWNDADYAHNIIKCTKEEAESIVTSYELVKEFMYWIHQSEQISNYYDLADAYELLERYDDYEELREDCPWIFEKFNEADLLSIWYFLEECLPWGYENKCYTVESIEIFEINSYNKVK